MPVSEVEEYTGMPAFSEIGPIQMDPEVQNTVQDMIRHNSAILIANLTGSNMTSVPNGCVYIKIDSNKLKITHQNDREIVSVDLDKENPKIHILHKTNTGFSLIFDDKKLDFSTEKPVERDIITIAVRMFCNKTVIEDQSDMLFKMQELSSRLFELNKDYELAVSNLNTLKGINEIYLKANENYQKNLQELETDNSELRDKNMKQESMLEKYESELQFLRQDILVYKEQNSSIESKLDQQRIIANDHEFLLTNIKENLIELLRKSHICEKCKNVGTILLEIYARLDGKFNDLDASSSNSSVRSFHDEISESTDENQDKEIREIREKLNLYKNKIKKYKTEKLEV